MMSKAIVLAVCQFLAHTELVSEVPQQPQYYHATLDYGYDTDCVYLDTETGVEKPCSEWEGDMMEGDVEEVNWDREVSGEGEWRFNPETSHWEWEGPVYEMEDLRYVPSEVEDDDSYLYFEDDDDETAWMTEPQETWVELEPQFRYFSSPTAKPVQQEEDEESPAPVTEEMSKMEKLKIQFDRLLKKGKKSCI